MAISTRQVKNKRDSNGVLTGRPGTVYDVNIKYTAPNGEKKTYSKKGFPTKKEATQHEAEMKAKLHMELCFHLCFMLRCFLFCWKALF